PMVVSWPARIKDVGGKREQFTHLIDIVPTIMDVAGLPAPKTVDGIDQKPMDGISFASTFGDAKARPVRQRQYFEIFTNRPTYDNGWIAAGQHTFPWRQDFAPGHWETISGNSTTSVRTTARPTIWLRKILPSSQS